MTHDEIISLRLSADTVRKIDVEARASFRSRSEVIRDTLGKEFPPFAGYDPRAAKAELTRQIRKRNQVIFAK